MSVSGLAALTEDEAARFQQDDSPHDIKADIRSEQEFLEGRPVYALDESRESKLIAAAILELFKLAGHVPPSSLAPGLREIAEHGCLVMR